MATAAPTAAPAVQLRSIPLSAIVPIDGFNPRQAFDDAELRALSTSMLERGCLVPILVQATGDGAYRLVDGEKRYKAAAIAALMELPAIVRAVDAGESTTELEAELLVDAVVANQLRSQLTPIEEALACRRLKTEHGLTVKGIAQRLQMTQARVRDRLAILELPDTLWPRIARGEIPVSAISALGALAKIHRGLPEVAVTIVLDRGDVYGTDPYTWREVAADALSVVTSALHDQTVDAPDGVFVSSRSYPLSAFTLDDKHEAAAVKLAELRGTGVNELVLRFDHGAIEQARKLKAAHAPDHGWVTLIVGQDVADTIAADHVTAALKRARADAKRQRDSTRATSSSPDSATTDAGQPVDEDAKRDLARAERAEAAAERERCALFNEQLGVAIVNSVSRVKVDERTVKILTAINVAAELDRIAMRGARYGFPGWVTIEKTKRATKRRYLEQRHDAQAKAIDYLQGAKTAGEFAGRTIALLMMAVYAKENAVAASNRAFHTVTVQSALPWAEEVAELIDELAAEKLPAALIDPVLSTRRAAHAARHAAAAEKADALQRVPELEARIDDLDAGELDELERVGRVAHGAYSIASHELRDKVRVRRSALTDTIAPASASASTAETEANGDVGADDGRDLEAGDANLGDKPAATAASDMGDGDGEQAAQ
jgi:ParB/RepB/Spo0J family partition protein